MQGSTVLERGRVASPTRGCFFTPGKAPPYSFYKRLGEFQDQCGHEEVKKNLHLSKPGIEPERLGKISHEDSCPNI